MLSQFKRFRVQPNASRSMGGLNGVGEGGKYGVRNVEIHGPEGKVQKFLTLGLLIHERLPWRPGE